MGAAGSGLEWFFERRNLKVYLLSRGLLLFRFPWFPLLFRPRVPLLPCVKAFNCRFQDLFASGKVPSTFCPSAIPVGPCIFVLRFPSPFPVFDFCSSPASVPSLDPSRSPAGSSVSVFIPPSNPCSFALSPTATSSSSSSSGSSGNTKFSG